MRIEGFKVFSATKAGDRIRLGDRLTEWLNANGVEILYTWVLQSSDSEFHCLSVVVAYCKRP